MYAIAKLPDEERRTIFRNTATKMLLNEAMVEKDFWLCVILDYLFHHSFYHNSFIFKGGTSLSKGFHLINRFSEDVDLILDWRILGYGEDEPWLLRSNTKQDIFNKEINFRAEEFIRNKLFPDLLVGLSERLDMHVDLKIDEMEHQNINFAYPHIFKSEAILQNIRLEIGPLAAWTPARDITIVPYIVEQYPNTFSGVDTKILTVNPERTFWEKATILHQEACRPETLIMPSRYSRHYYDLYCMAQSDYKNEAFNKVDLLKKVVEFKMKFYPRKWARYDLAKLGTLKLYPPVHSLEILKADYKRMEDMFYGTYPKFAVMMDGIKELEIEINNLITNDMTF